MPNEYAEADDTLLYDIASLRAIEQAALAMLPAGTLMQRAGTATAALARLLLTEQSANVLVVAGPGNNGGDALDAAARLQAHGCDVSVVLLADAVLPPDAAAALQRARGRDVSFITLAEAEAEAHWALAIDGLFGIGQTRAADGEFRCAIERLNALACPVIAIDVPSGLHADTGALIGNGVAVRADHTLTFIGDKPGLHTAHGRDCAGTVHVDKLEISPSIYAKTLQGKALASLTTPAAFRSWLAPRVHASHKGSFGDLTVIGGARGMAGAVVLAARTAAMAGAGRVFAAFAEAPPPFDPLHPELMCRDARQIALDSGAVVIGPGLGTSTSSADLLIRALDCSLPLVLDADALNLLAADPALCQRLAQRPAPALMTPHPLEAARLLGSDVAAVQADRLHAAATLAARCHAHVILKGSGSVIASPDSALAINPTGNPALATAGSGDVLAGLCGALLAQRLPVAVAALAATWLHGQAADQLVADGIGPIGLTASDLPPAIRSALNAQSASTIHAG